jgi:hypothetical protein
MVIQIENSTGEKRRLFHFLVLARSASPYCLANECSHAGPMVKWSMHRDFESRDAGNDSKRAQVIPILKKRSSEESIADQWFHLGAF